MKYIWFLLLLTFSNHWNFLYNESRFYKNITDIIKGKKPNIHYLVAVPAISDDLTEYVLQDRSNRVSFDFKIKEYLYPSVHFWFKIYTHYTSKHIVIHDKDDLSLVYAVIDFKSLSTKDVPASVAYNIQQKIAYDVFRDYQQALVALQTGKRHHLAGEVKAALEKFNIKRSYSDLIKNIRYQTGQRDLISAGIKRYEKFKSTFLELSEEIRLPNELLYIPFLESSFNNRAESKVGALGVWQFMPLIASYFLPKRTNDVDYRLNPVLSSVAALQLLRENFQLLKNWDLAVTSYNSGTKHIIKARRQLGFKNFSLQDYLEKYDHAFIGFASQNFYAEFQALVHALRYSEEVYDISIFSERVQAIYVSKCSVPLNKIDEYEKLLDENPQFLRKMKLIPKASILTSVRVLNPTYFKKITFEELGKRKITEVLKKISYSCSTK